MNTVGSNIRNKELQTKCIWINLFKTFETGLQISEASKNIWKVLQFILLAFVQIGEISFQEHVFERISQPVFYGDLV